MVHTLPLRKALVLQIGYGKREAIEELAMGDQDMIDIKCQSCDLSKIFQFMMMKFWYIWMSYESVTCIFEMVLLN